MTQREIHSTEREREKIFYLLICFSDAHNNYSWAKPKAGSRKPIWISCVAGRNSVIGPSFVASQMYSCLCEQEAGLETEVGTGPGILVLDAGLSADDSSHCTVRLSVNASCSGVCWHSQGSWPVLFRPYKVSTLRSALLPYDMQIKGIQLALAKVCEIKKLENSVGC